MFKYTLRFLAALLNTIAFLFSSLTQCHVATAYPKAEGGGKQQHAPHCPPVGKEIAVHLHENVDDKHDSAHHGVEPSLVLSLLEMEA